MQRNGVILHSSSVLFQPSHTTHPSQSYSSQNAFVSLSNFPLFRYCNRFCSFTFVQCLNRKTSTISSDLEMLDSMLFVTISFEELLGLCNKLYKKSLADLLELKDCLSSYGYVQGIYISSDFKFVCLFYFWELTLFPLCSFYLSAPLAFCITH
jgi:hypothetical protein